MESGRRSAILTRLRTARGHLDGVLRMVDDDAYCPDVMKQLSAVQGTLEATSRLVLRNHLETCVADAMQQGRVQEIVDELMETLKYDKRVWRPAPTDDGAPPAPSGAERAERAATRATNATDAANEGGGA